MSQHEWSGEPRRSAVRAARGGRLSSSTSLGLARLAKNADVYCNIAVHARLRACRAGAAGPPVASHLFVTPHNFAV